MPPMKKGGKRRSSSKRIEKSDWIYNDDAYSALNINLDPGAVAAIAWPLNYAQNSQRAVDFTPHNTIPLATAWHGAYTRVAARRETCVEVDGGFRCEASTWNVGNSFTMRWRLAHHEQDPETAEALLEPDYSLTNVSNAVSLTPPAAFANYGFLKEGTMVMSNVAGTAVTSSGAWFVGVKWKGRCTIGPSRGMYVLVESVAGSITLRLRPWLRSRWLRPG